MSQMMIALPNPRFIGYSNFGQNTPKQVQVNTGSTQLLAANPNRLYAEINNNGPEIVWVQLGIDAVVGEGKRLSPGSMLNFVGNELYLGTISAISKNGMVNVNVIEGV